jgi:DNA-binding NarL/FixJ family response regulator
LIRTAIEEKTSWQVCGEAENGKEAVDKVRELSPDVVILDMQMPVMNGLQAAEQIAKIAPATPLLMFTMHISDELLRIAQAAGIRDVLSKCSGMPDNLISAVQRVLESKTFAASTVEKV